jgi:TP901 family phage tail tape measure protein
MADIGEIRARLVLNSQDFTRGMQQARTQMDQTNRSAQRTSKAIDKIHSASAGFATAVGAVFAASIGVAANFEQKMKDVQAVSGESADNMKSLTDLALDMGKKTAFSAAEAASGIEELVKAGVSVTDILNGGLEGALNLAIAGNLDLAEAAEISSTALNAFKKDALTVSQAADILAGAANASATDVHEMRYGLSMVSAVASGVGLSFKDTSTALAVFAQNGLKGSDAGTSLKTMLLNLIPQTKKEAKLFDQLGVTVDGASNAFFDSHGNIKSLAEISQVLQDKLKDLTNEQRQATLAQMFGTDAIRAGNILYKEGAKGITEMWEAMSKVKAADVAKVKLDTLKGAFTELTSAAESVGISIGMDFLPALTNITRKARDIVGSLDDMKIANIEGALAFGGTAAAVALLITTVAKLGLALRAVAASPVGLAIVGISLLAGVIGGAIVKNNALDESVLNSINTRIKEHDSIDESVKRYDALQSKTKLTADEFARFVDIQSDLQKTSDPQVIADLTKEADNLQKKSGLSNDELTDMVKLNGDLIEKVPEATKHISDQGNAILDNTKAIKDYNAAQLDSAYKDLDLQRLKTETEYKNLLEKEKSLIAERKNEEGNLQTLLEKRKDAQKLSNDEEAKLKDMMADTAKYSDAARQTQIEKTASAKQAVEVIQSQIEKQANSIQQTDKELDTTRKKLKAQQDIRDQMNQIILKQVGLTSEKGKELQSIDSAIAKLKGQRAELEKNTPVAQRNTTQFREARDAIDQQIGKLQTARGKVSEITNAAKDMNAELAKSVTKWVNVYVQEQTRHSQYMPQAQLNKQNPDYNRHTGGTFPKLHVGGSAAQFASTPNHNEVDVRLLRNEMVLTEAQQSNLFRMLDAGMTGGNNGAVASNGMTDALLREQNSLLRALVDKDLKVDGNALWNYVDTKQATQTRMDNRNGGIKR